MVDYHLTLSRTLNHAEICDILCHPSVIIRRILSTFRSADPRELAKIRSPLFWLRVPRVSWEPVDGVVQIVPVIKMNRVRDSMVGIKIFRVERCLSSVVTARCRHEDYVLTTTS